MPAQGALQDMCVRIAMQFACQRQSLDMMCASDRRFGRCRPANIALQDTCLLQASESRFARYIPADVAMQASGSRSASNMQAKIAHDMSKCYFSTISFQHITLLIPSKAIYAKQYLPRSTFTNNRLLQYARHSCKRVSIPQSELCMNCSCAS